MRSDLVIREANREDLKRLKEWLNPGGDRLPVSQNPTTTNFIACHKKRLVGFVQLLRRPQSESPFSGHSLFSLEVKLAFRGMGIGEALSLKVIEQARVEGSKELSLVVFSDNQPAIKLYQKLGFLICETLNENAPAPLPGGKSHPPRIVMRIAL